MRAGTHASVSLSDTPSPLNATLALALLTLHSLPITGAHRLLFTTVDRYVEARAVYCKELLVTHSTFYDETTRKELRIEDQRVYLTSDKALAGTRTSLAAGRASLAAVRASVRLTTGRASTTGEMVKGAECVNCRSELNLSSFVETLLDMSEGGVRPRMVRVCSKQEHELLHSCMLHATANRLNEGDGRFGLVPVIVTMHQIAEQQQALAQSGAKQPARASALSRYFETEYPQHAEMLKQVQRPPAMCSKLGQLNS